MSQAFQVETIKKPTGRNNWIIIHLILFLLGSNYTRKCYGALGCLEINEDWFGMTRPVNVLPQERSEINTQFFIRTRDNPRGVS